MSLFKVFDISASAISAQSQRLNVVASNLANADSVAGPDGKPYKARQVVFQTQMYGEDPSSAGVAVSQVVEDNSAPRKVHDPQNPAADTDGFVTMPNVNPIEEMVNMISASRGYQTNVDVMNTAKGLLQKVLQLGS
jgi:flagellar basal-body rod protein FlgC